MNGHPQELLLSLGGNEQNTEKCFRDSLQMLSTRFGNPVLLSSIYETQPWGFQASTTPFLNQLVTFHTEEEIESILEFTQAVEKMNGRKSKSSQGQYSNRTLDIDILCYGTQEVMTENLVVPHKFMHERNFILVPLKEILPNFIHPTLKKTLKELLLSTQDNSTVSLYKTTT